MKYFQGNDFVEHFPESVTWLIHQKTSKSLFWIGNYTDHLRGNIMAQSYIQLICLHFNINISWHSLCVSVRYQDGTISSYTICWHSNTTKAFLAILDLKYRRLNNVIENATMNALFQKDVNLTLCILILWITKNVKIIKITRKLRS